MATAVATEAFSQLTQRELLNAFTALKKGDFSFRLPDSFDGDDARIADAFNEIVERNQQITEEFERLAKVVGKEGKTDQRARVRGATGGWGAKMRAVNELIDDLAQPTAEVARVIGAVASPGRPPSCAAGARVDRRNG